MVTYLIRAVNHFTGKSQQPIRLELIDTADVDSIVVIGIMRIDGLFAFYNLLLPFTHKERDHDYTRQHLLAFNAVKFLHLSLLLLIKAVLAVLHLLPSVMSSSVFREDDA